MNKHSVAKHVLSRQDETFIYLNEDGDLVIEQPYDAVGGSMVIIGKSSIVQFASSLMELVLKPSED